MADSGDVVVEMAGDVVDMGGLLKVIQNNYGTEKVEESAVVRFRPPFIQTPKHDARGDAIALAMDHLLQRGVPLWASNLIGCSFVDAHVTDLQTAPVPFVEGVYEPIDASVWCREVIKALDQHMRKIAKGEIPPPEKPLSWEQYPFSYCAQKNRRPKMEDKAAIFPSLCVVEPSKNEALKNDAFFAIFDGHNGIDCATYASSHFHRCLVEENNYASDLPDRVMKNTFKVIDQRLEARCINENLRGGTTAVCVWLRGRHLCIGWCGDSAAAVLRADTVRTLTSAHSPDVASEARRIQDAGGMVLWVHGELRVNGILNLTRSLGDIDGRPMISPEPDTVSFELDGSEYLLMLACDGVWDMFNDTEVYNHIKQFVSSSSPKDYAKLSEYLTTRAKDAGATDNLTMLCVFLRPVADLWDLFK
uniref:PPM-type phosphatase domain-containing protein n=1 Tax=Parascaris univalens TaxID=6257 RepID=A0A915AG48_PARUN